MMGERAGVQSLQTVQYTRKRLRGGVCGKEEKERREKDSYNQIHTFFSCFLIFCAVFTAIVDLDPTYR
jgi:hypothetical protein